jgi:hypothetical protein
MPAMAYNARWLSSDGLIHFVQPIPDQSGRKLFDRLLQGSKEAILRARSSH